MVSAGSLEIIQKQEGVQMVKMKLSELIRLKQLAGEALEMVSDAFCKGMCSQGNLTSSSFLAKVRPSRRRILHDDDIETLSHHHALKFAKSVVHSPLTEDDVAILLGQFHVLDLMLDKLERADKRWFTANPNRLRLQCLQFACFFSYVFVPIARTEAVFIDLVKKAGRFMELLAKVNIVGANKIDDGTRFLFMGPVFAALTIYFPCPDESPSSSDELLATSQSLLKTFEASIGEEGQIGACVEVRVAGFAMISDCQWRRFEKAIPLMIEERWPSDLIAILQAE